MPSFAHPNTGSLPNNSYVPSFGQPNTGSLSFSQNPQSSSTYSLIGESISNENKLSADYRSDLKNL